MVDTTAAAFGMQPATSRGRNVPRRREVEAQTEEAFAAEEPRLERFSLPMGANPDKDQLSGVDELGNQVYISPLGVRYTIKTTTPQPKEWQTEPATMARVGEVAKEYATGAVEGLTGAITAPGRALAGEPVTTGEVLDTAGFAATGAIPGIARGAIQGVDPNVASVFAGLTGYSNYTGKPMRGMADAYDTYAKNYARLRKEAQDNNTFVPEETLKYQASEDTWNQTGFFIGQDGDVRFEIDDSKATITPTKLTEINGYQYARDLIDRNKKTTTLQDFLKHDELFKAYPQLKDLPVFVDNSLAGTNTRGWFDPAKGKNSIALNPDIIGNDYVLNKLGMNTLLHEIQHYIQDVEGFDKGTNLTNPEIIKIYSAETKGIRGKEIQDQYLKDKAAFDAYYTGHKAKVDSDIVDFYTTLLQDKYGVDASKIIEKFEASAKRTEDSRKLYDELSNLKEKSLFSFFSKSKVPSELTSSLAAFLVGDLNANSLVTTAVKRYQQDFNDFFSTNLSADDLVDKTGRYRSPNIGYDVFLPDNIKLPEKPLFIDPSQPFSQSIAQNIYERSSGETESRNVPARKDFTPEKRAATFPRVTEDVLPQYQWTGDELKRYPTASQAVPSASASSIQMPSPEASQRTQIAGTFPTYQKALKLLEDTAPEGKTLDYGAGLGKSSELGFDTFEPYAREGFEPTYRSSSDIPDASYARITNLNVLNVVDPDTRSNIVQDIGRILKPDGVAIITARGRDVLTAKGEKGPEDMSVITTAGTYQKGFTRAELVDYLQNTLGESFEVSPLQLGPAGARIRKLPNTFAQGGMVDYNTETQMNRLMQEGGIADDGMRRDPVSGNEVPPGSMAEEVRDDIPAQLSSGEYVVPADVLRYYGVAFFEKLRAKAKQGLAEMEAGGRIGGEPVAAPMRGMEYDDELDDEDEMMLQQVMGGGMAQGGMMMSRPQQAANYYGLQPTMKLDRQMAQAFQQGGVAVDPTNIQQTAQQFTSAFDPTKFKPGFMFDQPTTGTAAVVEMRTYVNAQGEIRMIPFQNGQPLEPIPEGFYPQGQVPATTQVQQDSGNDNDRGDEQEPPKPYTEYTAEDWNKYNTDRSFGSKFGQVVGGVIGTAIAGPFGGIAGSNLAAEAIARDGIKAYNALNDFIGNMDENNPSYQDLVDKRNEMYNAITEAQKKEPGFIGGILEKIFGKPVVTPPKSGGGRGTGGGGGGGGTGGGGAADSSRDEGANAVVDTSAAAVRRAAEATGAGAATRTAQDQKLGAGARESNSGTLARSATSAATARSYKESVDDNLAPLAKGGLMVKKRVAKKAAKKRPIKTTDA